MSPEPIVHVAYLLGAAAEDGTSCRYIVLAFDFWECDRRDSVWEGGPRRRLSELVCWSWVLVTIWPRWSKWYVTMLQVSVELLVYNYELESGGNDAKMIEARLGRSIAKISRIAFQTWSGQPDRMSNSALQDALILPYQMKYSGHLVL